MVNYVLLLQLTLVLKQYGISTLDPQVWEAVDHEKEGPLAGTLTGEDGGASEEIDPLGLRNRLTPYVSALVSPNSCPRHIASSLQSNAIRPQDAHPDKPLIQGFRPKGLPLRAAPRCVISRLQAGYRQSRKSDRGS